MDNYSEGLTATLPDDFYQYISENEMNLPIQDKIRLYYLRGTVNEKIQQKKEEYLFTVFSNKTDFLKIVEEFLAVQPIYYDSSKNWWIWNQKESCWKIIDETDLFNEIDKYTRYPSVNSQIKAELLEAFKRVSRRNKPNEIKTTWIQFKDTFIDILTGKEIKVSPKYFAVNPIPYNLHREKYVLTPTIDKLFEEWVGIEHVKKLYQIMAYCLLPDYPIHRLFCLIGAGMNGKGCFLRMIEKFIGKNNCCSTELDTLLTSRFEVTRLHKKLVCIMGETNFNEMSKTSMLKKLTGQDIIGFEYKGKNPFDDHNYAKILIATNNLPSTTDKTIGFYRRWLIIDFPNQFSEQEDVLKNIPEEEFEILALKCVDLLRELIQDRKFDNEGSIEERQKKYEDKSNFLEQFIRENTLQDINGDITKADFFKKFCAWCKENRHREMSEVSVGMAMKKMGIQEERRYYQWMYDGKGGQARVWVGIKWN